MVGNLIFQDSSRSGSKARSGRYLQRFFLARLRRMVAMRREYAPLPEASDLDLRLLDKAIYSTFCDCLDSGVDARARAVLRHEDLETPADELQGPDPEEIVN